MDVTYVQRNLQPAVAKAVAANFLLADHQHASLLLFLGCCCALRLVCFVDKEDLGRVSRVYFGRHLYI
jgi:hypothetical protein